MINKFIRNFIAKQMAGRSDDGIMITLKDPQKVTLAENIMAELLMRNGIDPRIIKSEDELKMILQQIENARIREIQNTGIRNTESAKVFDLEGKEIPPGSKIMGGQADDMPPPGSRGGPDDIAAPVQSSEETLKNMIQAENKKNIAKIKQRQKMLDDAIEDASPGFANDIKYDSEIVAENLAERMGLVYDDLPTKQRLDLYDQAYTGLSKKRFKQRQSLEDFVDDAGGVDESDPRGIDDFIPEPEDKAKGGRAGFSEGNGVADEDAKNARFARRVRELMDEGFDMGEAVREAMKEGYAKGGIARIGLKDGMNRRTFLKLLGGAMSIPIVGKILKPFKIGKTVTKVPIIKTDNVPGKPEWFDQLVNKVILEGDDVTKRFATKERQIVHAKQIDEDNYVTVTQDLDEGAVVVEYESPTTMFGEKVDLRYKKPPPDEGDPRPVGEFQTEESGIVGRAQGPDDYDLEIEGMSGRAIEDLESDVSVLKQYATGKKPTLKEIVQSKKRKDKVKYYETPEGQSEYVVQRQGEYDYSPDDGMASGGIARMLGE
jgi:hypothetical protein